jgi:hypothetical protein
MPKDFKGNAGRKPPEPIRNHDDIDVWIRRQMPDLQEIILRLDTLIRKTHSPLNYAVSRKRAYYGLSDFGWIIELAAYDVSVNVVFLGGADFSPPPPLGTADRTRYIKVTSVADTELPELLEWIKQAGRVPGWTQGGSQHLP